MREPIETTESKTSKYTQFGGESYRQPDMIVSVSDRPIQLKHVEVANTGFINGETDRPIVLFTADLQMDRGQVVYLAPEEAATIGRSLLRLADPAYREREEREQKGEEGGIA